MSTGAIVAIVIGAIIVLALIAMVIPRMRARKEERRVAQRREEVAGAHRELASERAARAELAEREARRERAEAELHEARAELHERGMADDELDRDHGRFVRERQVEEEPVADERAGETDDLRRR